jgi:PPK2 family polyphosphate:nucleotide phosphotransferase
VVTLNKPFAVADIHLNKLSTRAPKAFDKQQTQDKTAEIIGQLDELQNLLYAESKHSVLVIIQGMDAAGKDGLIRDVFGQMNPQGVRVCSFKEPTERELAHDFLWRIHLEAPPKGIIQVFNRSHYEDILVTRVHKYCNDEQARERMKAINDFEWLLAKHNNTRILKFYLHISQEEQRSRLEERISNPQKQWKYNENDFTESGLWKIYRKMYEDCFKNCDKIPWHIIPSDQNWYKNYLVAQQIHDTLKGLKMRYPGLKK